MASYFVFGNINTFQYKIMKGTSNPICSLLESALLCSLSSFPTGRGLKSHAYIHSVQFSHHVFLNLHTLKFYCLPDNYEIIDSSLEDITVRVPQAQFGTSSAPESHPWDPGVSPTQGKILALWSWRHFFPFGRNQGN